MITKSKLTLTSFFLLFVCSAWVPSSVFSQPTNAEVKAGHIVVGSGRLIARAADGTERRLRRRATVYAGDTIVVGKNAFVQIRFTDGGLFSLRPDSEFKVSEYRHQEQKDENGKVVFELLKGGLRTISGSIGKKDKENYQLKTPVSTIGIRGTHYGVRLCTGNCTSPQGDTMADGLYGGVVDGAISVKNQSGEGIIGNDQYFHVGAMDAPLQQLIAPPGVVFDPAVNGLDLESELQPQPGDEPPPPGSESSPPENEPLSDFAPPPDTELLVVNTPDDTAFAIDDAPKDPDAGTIKKPLEGDSAGSAASLDTQSADSATQALNLTPAPLGSGVAMAVNDGKDKLSDSMMGGQKDLQSPELFIDANHNLIHVEHYGRSDCQPCIFDKGTATLTDTGSLPILGDPNKRIYWGRWEGAWKGQDSLGSHTGQGSWHFMYSPHVITQNALDALKVSGPTNAAFSLVSIGDGTQATDEMGNMGVTTAASMNVNFQAREISNYQVNVNFSGIGRNFYGTQKNAVVLFSGPGTDFELDVNCSGCSTSTGTGRSNVIFVGANASHVINSFNMQTDDGVNNAVGTVHMTR